MRRPAGNQNLLHVVAPIFPELMSFRPASIRAGTDEEPDRSRWNVGLSSNNCRQRPTLPRSFPRSTIGGSRLNFRVRNGNGCDPAPVTTGILGAWGPLLRAFRRFGGQATLAACRAVAREASGGGVVPDDVKERAGGFRGPQRAARPQWPRLRKRRPTEYPANGSFTATHHSVNRKYGQASRLISIGKLNVSPRLHTRPITWSSSRSL